MKKKVRVGLVYGGKSGEHEVSLQTAFAVINAFDFEKYELIPFYITREGEWRKGELIEGPLQHIQQLKMENQNADGTKELSLDLPLARHPVAKESAAHEIETEMDVVFPLLHGTYGEDGTIQGLLEMMNIPYVGAGVLASAVGMDKVFMKKIFAQEGFPQCLYRYFTRHQWEKDRSFFIMEIEISLGYPCFVKPANLGSSVGISKAGDRNELIRAVEEAFRYDRKVIVEEYVDAREIEVGVLGYEEPQASVCGEVISSNEFYDYRAKYIDGKSQLIIPADLDEEVAENIRAMAVRAFQAIDCTGLARVDFFLRRSDGAILINEINTMPGFTPYSMYPLLWKHSGKSYRELLDDLIEIALKRYNDKQQLEFGHGFEQGSSGHENR
mgnify:CR=1 FL=1|jgi:D-alanine-D-alanine ligase